MVKQVLLVRSDLDMTRGKCIAQGSHVSVLATRKANEEMVIEWIEEGGKKIVLEVKSEEELINIINSVDNLPTAKIRDLGYTQLEPNTLTAGAIGPGEKEAVDKYTSDLALFQ